jgi:hypothetical protein
MGTPEVPLIPIEASSLSILGEFCHFEKTVTFAIEKGGAYNNISNHKMTTTSSNIVILKIKEKKGN